MGRAIIALRMQSPEPVLQRLPAQLYYAVALGLVVLTATVSTRAALIYRSDLSALRAKVVYVQRVSGEQRDVRRAALLAFAQRPQPPLARQGNTAPVAPDKQITLPVPPTAVPALQEAPSRPVVRSAVAPVFSVSSRLSPLSAPATMAQALRRLSLGRDDVALAWARDHWRQLPGGESWERFKHLSMEAGSVEHRYQLAVLYTSMGEPEKSRRLLTAAQLGDTDPRYVRAFAVACDHTGDKSAALRAYRRYLSLESQRSDPEVRARVALLSRP